MVTKRVKKKSVGESQAENFTDCYQSHNQRALVITVNRHDKRIGTQRVKDCQEIPEDTIVRKSNNQRSE